MRRFFVLVGIAGLLIVAWFIAWHSLMAADVARVKASIAYHDTAIKALQPHVTLKADDVQATGFPFGFRILVIRPILSQITGNESFAISLPSVELQKVDTPEGRYRVLAPDTFEAMYAEQGAAPEQYQIRVSPVPAVLLRAQGNSQRCSPLPGAQHCPAVAEDAPLISFAAQLPESLMLDVTLNDKTKHIGFHFTPVNVPIFMTIPADMDRPLQLFVGMLREAMVYNTTTR